MARKPFARSLPERVRAPLERFELELEDEFALEFLEELELELLDEFEEEFELELLDELELELLDEFELELLDEFEELLPATTNEPSALLDEFRAGSGASIAGGKSACAGVVANAAVPTMKAVMRLCFFMTSSSSIGPSRSEEGTGRRVHLFRRATKVSDRAELSA